jgi:hypothetical protein
MHEEGNNWVVMIQVGFSEVDVGIIDDWIKITVLI